MSEKKTDECVAPTDAWMEVTRLIMKMPAEERVRCLAATTCFLQCKDEVIDRLSRCSMCGRRLKDGAL